MLSDYKKQKVKKSRRIRIFSKELVHGFGKKIEIFHLCILGKISQQNVFDVILDNQKAFLDYKNRKLKKLKNWDFSKGVNPWFW